MNKVIYLGTTIKCSACKLQERLLKQALENRSDIELNICDYTELPQWLQNEISLTDFPITIFIEDEVIKYHIIGTMSVSKLKALIEDVGF